jgi:hypothetical protein
MALIALVAVGVQRRQREHRRAELAKTLRYQRWKARRRLIPHVSANLCGSRAKPIAPILRSPDWAARRARRLGLVCTFRRIDVIKLGRPLPPDSVTRLPIENNEVPAESLDESP